MMKDRVQYFRLKADHIQNKGFFDYKFIPFDTVRKIGDEFKVEFISNENIKILLLNDKDPLMEKMENVYYRYGTLGFNVWEKRIDKDIPYTLYEYGIGSVIFDYFFENITREKKIKSLLSK